MKRATEAEAAMTGGNANEAIGAASGIATMLNDASALYAAALALHRQGGRQS